MHESYYATAAQVIPVFLLVLTLSERFLLSRVVHPDFLGVSARWWTPRVQYRAVIAIVGVMAVGECVALASLGHHDDSWLRHQVVLLGFFVGLLSVTSAIAQLAYAERLRQEGRPER
jgi:hypothetical protein